MIKRFFGMLLLGTGLAGTLCCANEPEPLLYYPLNDLASAGINRGTAGSAGNAQGYLLHNENFVPAINGNGLHILGLADGLQLKNSNFMPENGLAVSLYFRADRMREPMTLVCFSSRSSDLRLTALMIENNRLVELDRVGHVVYPAPKNPRKQVRYVTGETLEVNRYYHLLWSMDGRKHRIYLNGKLILNKDSSIVPQKTDFMLIGNSYCPLVHQRDRFVGTIDEFKLFAAAPSDTWIHQAAEASARGQKLKKLPRSYDRVIGADEPPARVSLDPERCVFTINGQEEPVMIYAGGGFLAAAGYAIDTLPEAAASGMNIFRQTATGGREWCSGEWWYGIGKYDFEIVDRYMDIVFRENPNAWILLTLPASPPRWWGEQFPDEQCQDFNGRINHDYFASHSYSSQKWIADLETAWTAFFEHVKTRPYYKRIIGFLPVSGRYGEGLRAAFNSQLYGKEFTDYSPAETAAYRRWLQKNYGSIENMRNAYAPGRAPDDFASAVVPPPAERKRPDSFYFANPVHDRCNIDYMFFVNEQSAQAIVDFTTILRRLAGPDKIIGLYYGYMMEDIQGLNRAWASDSGHMALGKVLREAPVDFLCSPIGYYQRQLGCVGPLMGAPSSVRLHRKMWLEEADIRTSLATGKAAYSGAKDLEESKAVLYRSFGNQIVNRDGIWYYPINGRGDYSHPEIWQAFKIMHQELRKQAACQKPDDRTKRIALIIDPYSNHFRRHSFYDQLSGNLLTGSRDVFAKAAVGYDYYITDDLLLIPDDYPVYIFLNSFYMPDKQRQILRQRFKKDNKVLVFTYGSGLFRHGQYHERLNIKPANVEDATGIKVNWHTSAVNLDSVPDKNPPWNAGKLSIRGQYNPAFFVTDDQAQTLNRYTAPELAGKTAVACKNMGNWRSVFIGTPEFTEDLVRALANYGGAHVYSDAKNVVIRSGNGYILIHSGHDDNVNIFLPEQARKITDVTGNKVVAENCIRFTLPIRKNRTIVLRIE